MAGKKKKKPAANPARGFATVSQPSKAKEVVQSDDESPSQLQKPPADHPVNGDNSAEYSKLGTNDKEAKTIAQMTPNELEAHLEDAELRNLVEQNASRIKAEATRQASKLKNERRQLRQQADQASIYGLSDVLIDNILQNSIHSETLTLKSSKSSTTPELEETQLLQKLWLLQEVLKQLRVKMLDEVLTHVLYVCRHVGVEPAPNSVWGLEESLTWIAGFGGADESWSYDSDHLNEIGGRNDVNMVDDTDDSFQDLRIDVDQPSTNGNTAIKTIDAEPQSDTDMTSSNDDDEDPENFIERWLRLRTRLFVRDQAVKLSSAEPPRFKNRKLIEKIKRIERDILFDKDLAQQRWQVVLRDLEIQSAKARKQPAVSDVMKKQSNGESSTSYDVGETATMLGSIFDSENAEQQSAAATEHMETTIHHDFGTWNGVSPQKLLEEACTGLISRDGVRFRASHTTSYSARSHLHLKFVSPIDIDAISVECVPQGILYEQSAKGLALKMIATTTPTVQQSNAYLATVAMFLLISTGTINAKIASRLPKVWKELLNDLNQLRDELDLKSNIRELKHIRDIMNTSSQSSETAKGGPSQKSIPSEEKLGGQRSRNIDTDPPDQARSKWLERAASAAFAAMQPTRQSLPVYTFKEDILNAFHDNPILIICADTGAGKSTQIPSYILEDALSSGHDYRIMVTQPRRISAISIARRVSSELGEGNNALGTAHSLIGYAIRMESKTSSSTRVTFVTTGVLLRMLQESPNLDHLDCLVLDEVHERTMDLDLLFIALKRLRKRRGSLKIVLMSATVDATKFSSYFDNAPILNIPGRTFPVQVGFLEDAIEATLDVTDSGQALNNIEDDEYAREDDDVDQIKDAPSGLEKYSLATQKALSQYDHTRLNYNTILGLTVAIATKTEFTKYSKAILIFVPGISEIRRLHNLMLSTRTFSKGWVIHMLHSSFSTQDLEKAFLIPPKGCRKIVIATNIAETGITIPDVTAVIDTCKEKIMRFDERRQVSRLTEGFIARASARQRKGRAARVQDGLCFHLVTKHQFDTRMQDQPTPEMLRLSLQEPILRIKVWGLGPAEETLSEALDPPSMKNARRALAKLQDVGALDASERLTALGKTLAKLPLDVAMGKMAILGVFLQSLDAIVTIIASFSTKSIFVNDNSTTSFKEFARGDSDLLTVYNAYSGWKKACKQGTAQQFSQKYHLNHFQLKQLEEQKIQLFNYLLDAGLMSLTQDEYAALQRARNSRSNQYLFDVPARYDRLSSDSTINAITAMAFYPKILKREGQGYRNVYSNQQIQIAPTSINRFASRPPEWLCYLEATQTKNGRLNAFHSARVNQAALFLLLGQADFRYYAGVVDIDHGRIRLSLRRWREILALQHLRSQINRIMLGFLARPESPMSPVDQTWLDTLAVALDGSSQLGVNLPEQLHRSQQLQ